MNLSWPEPYWQVGNVRYYLGNVTDVLRTFPARSVQCIITSPPYYALRSYLHKGHASKGFEIGGEPSPDCNSHGQRQCGRCFVCTMVAVFREVRRVLRDDGVLWLNLGDTYAGSSHSAGGVNSTTIGGGLGQLSNAGSFFEKDRPDEPARLLPSPNGISKLPAGNLVGIPWRVALALQADGWVFRQDIIWHKPSPMPESVRNRCTKAHEYVFLLTKRADYYCDMDAVKEKALGGVLERTRRNGQRWDETKSNSEPQVAGWTTGYSNKRSVWSESHEHALLDWLLINEPDTFARYALDCQNRTGVWKVASFGYPGAHYATFPPELIRPCVRAGTSERGACAECGSPWRRVTEQRKLTRERPNDYVKRTGEEGTGNSCANSVAGVSVKTLGWEPTCSCDGYAPIGDPPSEPKQRPTETPDEFDERWQKWAVADEAWRTAWARLKPIWDAVATTPCVVLDPFIGSGTTAQVCIEEWRACVGIDLNEQYLTENAIPRVLPYLTPARLLPVQQGVCKALQGVQAQTRG